MKSGDLVWWCQGKCEVPGLVLDVKPSRSVLVSDASISSHGKVALVMLQELDNLPEWFHECELEKIEQFS